MLEVWLKWGENILGAEWQKKNFKDETAALEFIRKHTDKIFGINGALVFVPAKNHFEIIDYIRSKSELW